MRNIHEVQTMVTRADVLANVELYPNIHCDQYHWLCNEHFNSEKEDYHGVQNDHHHWLVWNEHI